ncbi:MAG: hypothetical protein OXN21_01245 [Chloroflexota bacterium]|nr:hypothetical protein [Chloroflexota bacterium]
MTNPTLIPTSMKAGSSSRADDLLCEICGAQMIQRQCKISCPNCGFTRDCSDP